MISMDMTMNSLSEIRCRNEELLFDMRTQKLSVESTPLVDDKIKNSTDF